MLDYYTVLFRITPILRHVMCLLLLEYCPHQLLQKRLCTMQGVGHVCNWDFSGQLLSIAVTVHLLDPTYHKQVLK